VSKVFRGPFIPLQPSTVTSGVSACFIGFSFVSLPEITLATFSHICSLFQATQAQPSSLFEGVSVNRYVFLFVPASFWGIHMCGRLSTGRCWNKIHRDDVYMSPAPRDVLTGQILQQTHSEKNKTRTIGRFCFTMSPLVTFSGPVWQ
jgi:hypothetical protein